MTQLIDKARILEALNKAKDLVFNLDKLHQVEGDASHLKDDLVDSFTKIKEDMNKLLADLSSGSKIKGA
jgi:hypothetical protein